MINSAQPSPGDASALLITGAERLAAAGVDSPRVDAELLLSHVLGVPRGRLAMIDNVHPSVVVTFERLVKRRSTREPLQHILGRAWFRHVQLAVGPGVFVPRPETELLVDAVLPFLRDGSVAVDLCSGSGALALALADEAPDTRVVAVERRGPAAEWLARNAAGSAVDVVLADVSDPDLLPELRGCVDAVVCNPPYVRDGAEIGEEVRRDPVDAVFAGPDGLALMPAVIARAAELLRPGRVLALEHDDTHGSAVPDLLAADRRWRDIEDHADLAGRPRYATAVRA